MLFTSRDERVLAAAGADVERIDVLPEATARVLLARLTATSDTELPAAAERVLES